MMTQTIIAKRYKDYLIIDKPAGLIVHSDGRTDEPTLCDWIVENYPEIAGVGEPAEIRNASGEVIMIDRPGIVHRLDRDTSGIMVIARNQKSFAYLKKQFKDRKVEKIYHAFVYGNIKEDELTIDEPIGRNKNNFRQWFAGKVSNIRGKSREAITHLRVLNRTKNKSVTLVEAKPKTGRTHQIRVHLKSIYHPIVADDLYAPDREKLLGFNRTALHAKSIRFVAPDGAEVFVEVPYPTDFDQAIKSAEFESAEFA